MDTTVEPMVLKIKRAIEAAIGIPVRVQQRAEDDAFEVILLDDHATNPRTTED